MHTDWWYNHGDDWYDGAIDQINQACPCAAKTTACGGPEWTADKWISTIQDNKKTGTRGKTSLWVTCHLSGNALSTTGGGKSGSPETVETTSWS